MEKCMVISDGDKIKTIREKYNLKQEEISGKDITRNLISEIETNKANITKKSAEIIIKNLTEIAKKKGFKVNETVEYLMENQVVQANKVLDDYIEELKTLVISKDGSFIETLKKAESFLIDWDIKDKKLKIYELAGDYFCSNNEMYKSVVYYEKASALLSRMFLDKELLPLSKKLSMVYGYMGNYEKSIECCDFALSCFEDMPLKDKVMFRYNKGLDYINTRRFELALKEIEIAESLVDKEDALKYFLILNNRGICLYKMKNYIEALKVFSKALDLINKDNVDKYLVALINIINSYWHADIKDKALENFDIVIKELPNISESSSYLSEIYFEVGKMYLKLNKLDTTEKYYLKALDYSEKQKNYVFENDILDALIEIYIVENNSEKMDNIKSRMFSLFNKQEHINHMMVHKLVLFYIDNNLQTAKELTSFVLKVN